MSQNTTSCSDVSSTGDSVSKAICFQHMVDVTSSIKYCNWCYMHETYPTAWYRDYFVDCERIHLFTTDFFMKMYFFFFLFYRVGFCFMEIYVTQRLDSDGFVLHCARKLTSLFILFRSHLAVVLRHTQRGGDEFKLRKLHVQNNSL